ncbi:MAG TPA: flavin reductase family protein [Brevundimonas sp.]|uniref:flavin reductase family protein n=1 Tax=Brevundimonas sp. TaxID=1871086 RepID=UPI002E0F825E|nr:flavin reductase family protein [Brevundimonas sp.]
MSQVAVPPVEDLKAYRQALGAFATGVCVVTADTPSGPVGITVNSFTSVSLQPRLLLWCLDDRSERAPLFAAAERYVIQVLGADQRDAAARFAKGDWALGEHEVRRVEGAPRLKESLAWFACEAERQIQAGDHLMILGRVLTHEASAGEGLTFHRGRFGVTETGA